jgi:hypothetical protein
MTGMKLLVLGLTAMTSVFASLPMTAASADEFLSVDSYDEPYGVQVVRDRDGDYNRDCRKYGRSCPRYYSRRVYRDRDGDINRNCRKYGRDCPGHWRRGGWDGGDRYYRERPRYYDYY